MTARTFPVRIDLHAYAGDAFSQTFGFRDADGVYINTGGWTGRMMVKARKDDATALLSTDPVVNEVKMVTITGAPTGGTFTLSFGGQTTAAIAYNATAADVRTALESLSTIGANNIGTSGGPLPGTAVTVTFIGSLGGRDVTAMGATSSLTGGTSPAVTTATTTQGSYNDILVTTGIRVTSPNQYNLETFITSTRMSIDVLRGLVGWYDLEVTDVGGRTTTLLTGRFLVEGDTTR
jgi:hypothetical protein